MSNNILKSLQIISYEKFKRIYKIKKYTSNVEANLYYNGIFLIYEGERKYDRRIKKFIEKNVDFVKKVAEIRDIKEGMLIYRSSYPSGLVEVYLLNEIPNILNGVEEFFDNNF